MWTRIPEATTCSLHFLQDGLQGEQLEALLKLNLRGRRDLGGLYLK